MKKSAPTLEIGPDLADLKQAHKNLYRVAREERSHPSARNEIRLELIRDVEMLLQRMKELAAQATDAEEFNWLTAACTEWQTIYSEVFNIATDVRDQVGVVSVPKNLTSGPPSFSESEIRSYLEKKAYEIGQSRKLSTLLRQVNYLINHRGNIHAAIPSTNAEIDEDWYAAQAQLALKIFTGAINFGRRAEMSSFPFLENVWLEDVKRVQAYSLWEQAGGCWDDRPERFYLQACDQLRNLVLDEKTTGTSAGFASIWTYLQDRYLDKRQISPATNDKAQELVRKKAFRLGYLQPARTAQDCWITAEKYVIRFYDNLYAAVVDRSPVAIGKLTSAIVENGQIVNAFETAVCIYFVEAELALQNPQDRRPLI